MDLTAITPNIATDTAADFLFVPYGNFTLPDLQASPMNKKMRTLTVNLPPDTEGDAVITFRLVFTTRRGLGIFARIFGGGVNLVYGIQKSGGDQDKQWRRDGEGVVDTVTTQWSAMKAGENRFDFYLLEGEGSVHVDTMILWYRRILATRGVLQPPPAFPG